MATEIVTAYLGVKLRDPEQSRALYLVANERGGPELVSHLEKGIVSAISERFRTASDGPISSAEVAATTILHAMSGPVLATLKSAVVDGYSDALREQLARVITAYLQSIVGSGPSDFRESV